MAEPEVTGPESPETEESHALTVSNPAEREELQKILYRPSEFYGRSPTGTRRNTAPAYQDMRRTLLPRTNVLWNESFRLRQR